MKKVILFVSLFIVLLLTAVAIWAYFAFLYTKPLNKAELAELTPDWSVVTHGNWSPWFVESDGTTTWNPAASFNAWLDGVPEEDKAWPVLVEQFYPYSNGALGDEYLGSIPYDAPQWEQLVDVISSAHSDEILAQLKVALSRPVMGVPILSSTDPYEHDAMIRSGLADDNWDPAPIANQNMMLVLLPSLGRHRTAANFLCSRAAYEFEIGNTEEFISLIEISIRSSKLSLEVPTLIGHLVQVAIVAKGFDTIDWALTTRPDSFNDAQLMQLDHLIAEHSPLIMGWQGEALMFHDTLRRLADSNGKINLRSMAAWSQSGGFDAVISQPCSLPELQLEASLQRPIAIYNIALKRTSELGALPWDQNATTGGQIIAEELGSVHFSVRLMMDILTPSLDNIPRRGRMHSQQAIALQTAIGLYRYHLQTGYFPESLDALGGNLLKVNPIDSYTGKPLKYILKDGAPLIYSVGDNGRDDQGEPLWYAHEDDMVVWPQWFKASELEENEGGGDWILYPILRGEPEPIEDDYDDWNP